MEIQSYSSENNVPTVEKVFTSRGWRQLEADSKHKDFKTYLYNFLPPVTEWNPRP